MKTVDHQFEDKLLEFAYGELPAPEASAVDSHVRGCARCSQSLAEIRGVRSSFQALPMEAAPDAGLDSLLAYAEQTARRNAAGPGVAPAWWRRWVAPLAGVAALALVGVVALRAQDEGSIKAQFVEEAAKQAPAPVVLDRAPSAQAQVPPAEPPSVAQAELAAEQKPEFADKNAEEKMQFKESGSRRDISTKGGLDSFGDGLGTQGKSVKKKSKVAGPSKDALSEDAVAQDFSNAALRGAGSKYDAPAPKVVTVAPAAEAPPPPPKAEAKKADERESQQAPAAVAAKPSPPAPVAAAPQQQSLGLSVGQGGRASGGALSPSSYRQGYGDDDRIAEGAESLADRKRIEADAQLEQRRRTADLEQLLLKARTAGNTGDRQAEVKLCQELLSKGATGYSRLEALNRLCTSLEALGQEDAADRYCAQVVSEFPTSAAANAIKSRNRTQLAPAPVRSKANKKPADLDNAMESPEKQKPADTKQAY